MLQIANEIPYKKYGYIQFTNDDKHRVAYEKYNSERRSTTCLATVFNNLFGEN